MRREPDVSASRLLPSIDNIEEGYRKNDVVCLRRREALSKWLESISRGDEEVKKAEDPQKTDFQNIFNLLSLHMVSEATKKAELSGNFRVATILSQAGKSPNVCFFCEKVAVS